MRRCASFHLVAFAVCAGGIAAACSSSSQDNAAGGSGGGGGSSSGSGSSSNSSGRSGYTDAGDPLFNIPEGGFPSQSELSITPKDPSLVVNPEEAPPTVQFEATGAGGEAVQWRVVNKDVGTIDQDGVFTPTGEMAGVVEIQAIVGNTTARTHVTVTIEHEQNGGEDLNPDDPGAGGLGGVGGEGFGPAVPKAILDLLTSDPVRDTDLELLYPYDETVFPLRILPPLLQWSGGSAGENFDGVYVHLKTGDHYDYKGFFGRPALLADGDNFVRHPIPPEVWASATRTAAGSTLELELVVSAGGRAFGPLRETWTISSAPVTGKIYYQAYGTALAENYEGRFGGGRFGGATLSIDVGSEGPELVAGTTTDDHGGCRVCHSVSAFGDWMLVQHGTDYTATSGYDLKNGNTEVQPYTNGTVGWAGIYPDGSIALANSIDVVNINSNDGDTTLYDVETGAAIGAPGLNEFATQIGLPMFSPDGKKVAFILFEGPSNDDIGPPTGRQLVVMDFDRSTNTFSNPRLLESYAAAEERPAWPTFMPSSEAVVFQKRWQGTNDEIFATRDGARGELWWADLETGTPVRLDRVNGVDGNGNPIIPAAPGGHEEDNRLNYEPTISPVASGGYAWMVFMSRRLYGNVATMGPYQSDPRNYDLLTNVTTKKIWMAAIDLTPEPGKDPSHPAFYIPGQELHGTNSRPFFALDPCVSDAGVCSTGIDCCSGFCRDGYCIPPPEDECSEISERCSAESDCCDPRAICVAGFCSELPQ